MTSIIFDIECDGYAPKNIWCIGTYCCDTGVYTLYQQDQLDAAYDLLAKADVLIGHNIKTFDLRIIEKLLHKPHIDRDKCFDTLEIAKLFFPDRKQKLADWGSYFGMPKTSCNFWKPSQQMYDYCLNDVKIIKLLYDHIIANQETGLANIKPRYIYAGVYA